MRRVISKNVKVAAMKAYVADGKTLREVAEEFGISYESLRRWLGDKVRPKGFRVSPSNGNSVMKSVVDKPVAISVGGKVEVVKNNSVYSRANSRWTSAEDELLRDAILSRMTVSDTVELLGRSENSIYCRKANLINDGFINDPSVKFVMPKGIRRIRKPLESPIDDTMTIENVEVESVVEEPRVEVQDNITNIELSDLAKLVKEFGVNITVSMTAKGMEVKMSN